MRNDEKEQFGRWKEKQQMKIKETQNHENVLIKTQLEKHNRQEKDSQWLK